ncbi:Oidioi.mRNA.OKI2018_I69.XSR.g15185.t1.cds [Oikopleura dioica]|uniref:Oidioi.mRNA.OKI2018_I69.XSR.g15185.t1.cds n=1 Tax=Oikopleura dioica TaxID=34765 RepID=A0ABN7SH51_OIKDI|nr:Oidioi.mRNA.OKI2018_I69.XSR.g15185.t1.cds [Oikopleura dioica]
MHMVLFTNTVQGASPSSTSSNFAPATKTSRKGPRLPKAVKKVLQKAHKNLEAATNPFTSDEKMAELFKEAEINEDKGPKSASKKKQKQGKTPNNTRKTKKPTRL